MVSAFLEMRDNDAAALGATLASLVPGAVEGVLREVVILDAGMGADVRVVAEHAGCVVRPAAELELALDGAKGEWVLLLEPGATLMPGWAEALGTTVAAAGDACRLTNEDRSLIARLSDMTTRKRPWRLGLVMRRRVLCDRARSGRASLVELTGGVRARPVPALIRPARKSAGRV
jgi:hypothetical protein